MSTVKPTSNLLEATAYWTASVRALESAHTDPLFIDPWASDLAGQTGAAWIEQRSAESVLPIVIRTRFFDTFLQRLTQQERIPQVVLLGAGLDTRAYRLKWPAQTRLFELDRPGLLDYKEQTLRASTSEPGCDRRAIAVDLTTPWEEVLINSGFDPWQPAVWLLEGFLFYLPNKDITRLLDAVTALASAGSWLGFDIINTAVLTSPLTRHWVSMQAAAGAPWIGIMDDPVAFLGKRGWQAELTQAGAADANYGRWTFPVIPTLMPDVPHNWYVTAQKAR